MSGRCSSCTGFKANGTCVCCPQCGGIQSYCLCLLNGANYPLPPPSPLASQATQGSATIPPPPSCPVCGRHPLMCLCCENCRGPVEFCGGCQWAEPAQQPPAPASQAVQDQVLPELAPEVLHRKRGRPKKAPGQVKCPYIGRGKKPKVEKRSKPGRPPGSKDRAGRVPKGQSLKARKKAALERYDSARGSLSISPSLTPPSLAAPQTPVEEEVAALPEQTADGEINFDDWLTF